MKTLDLPALWIAAGIRVEVLDGWELPANAGYVWRDGDPVCSMWHHTATNAYTPNRVKANAWAGLAVGDRLYASGDGEPTLVVANAYPAPISSGYGQQSVIDLAASDTPNDALAQGPDDVPLWAGNRSAWNTEVVLDGVGRWIDPEVWDMLITAANVLHSHLGWTKHRAIGHAQFTSRKIDLRDGRDPSTYETMIRFRSDMEDTMFTHFQEGTINPEWEPITWLLYILAGGTIDPNVNSSQISTLLSKSNVREVTSDDFDQIADLTGMDDTHRAQLHTGGLYRWGKEIAALRQYAYIND